MTGVLLTRPLESGSRLANRLATAGIPVVTRPLLALSPLPLTAATRTMVLDLDQYDHVIFVSQYAAEMGAAALEQYWPQWPMIRFYAVGPRTADVLASFGVMAQAPDLASSEGLLALPGLTDVSGQKVLIVRGTTGREYLADTLRERGATVTYLPVYERTAISAPDLGAEITEHGVTVAVVTSLEILGALVAALTPGEVAKLTVICASARIAAVAETEGFAAVHDAGGADDDTMYDAVCALLRP